MMPRFDNLLLGYMLFRNLKHLVIIILCACFISSCNQSISYKRPQLLANFGSFECNTNKLSKVNYSNIWNKIRNGFCLDTVHSPRIDKEIKWFMNNKAFLYRSIERAKPYLYHVVRELEKNNLPFELALLPIVESGYQPYAYSPSKAAGIWQFIPPTAREYGIKSNWWYDGRRDILRSTKAASHFLRDMHRHFKKDWLLAIASYNTGAGMVGRSIKKANYTIGNKTFWDLKLPRETEIYVPKLIALRDIISNPSAYNIKLPKIANEPKTNFISVKYPIDFYTISILSETDEKIIKQLNPGFNAWYFLPSMQSKLLLPIDKIKLFNIRYKKLIKLIYSKKVHLVSKGDTLSRISRNYNVSIKSIKVLNNLKSDLIIIGQKLMLPVEQVNNTSEGIIIGGKNYKIQDKTITYQHIVKRYDNWYKIARNYNVNLKNLLAWNNADIKATLKVSQKISINMKAPILTAKKEQMQLRYVVGIGDTVNQISTGFGVSRQKLLSDNGIKASKYLTAGKDLMIIK